MTFHRLSWDVSRYMSFWLEDTDLRVCRLVNKDLKRIADDGILARFRHRGKLAALEEGCQDLWLYRTPPSHTQRSCFGC